MATTIKMADMPAIISADVFQKLNSGKVKVDCASIVDMIIITDVEPKDLIYPEGWYYAKGSFRNKHKSTTGIYDEVTMLKSDGTFWSDVALYCTAE